MGKNIAELIREIAADGAEIYSALVRIDAVDDQAMTCDCTPLDGDAELFDVRLMPQAGNGVRVIPAVGSVGIVTFLSKDTAYLAMASEIDRVQVKIGDTDVDVTADGVVINGGTLGGMVKIAELEENLNSLKSFVEAMHAALPGAFIAVKAGAAADGPAGGATYANAMSGKAIVLKAMNDDKVKH